MAAKQKPEAPMLLLVDGHSLAFRSFYAFAKGGDGGLATAEGVPTSVTYGFLKALLENVKGLTPQGVVIAFDTAEPTFRHLADVNYKAHRDVAPEHFFTDLDNLREILAGPLNLSLCLAPGYEADDVLGTLANRAANDGWRVRILSGDRDLFQLVDDERDIAVLYMGGGGPYAKTAGPVVIDREGVIAKLGVTPEGVVDLKALTGDSSDNIPGVKGVGPKTAITLLKENGTLDGVYAALEALSDEKASQGALKGALKAKLSADKANAYLSRHLAEILIDIPLPSEPRLELAEVDGGALARRLTELELHSLVRQLGAFERAFSADHIPHTDPAAALAAPEATATPTPNTALPSSGDEPAPAGALPALRPQIISTPEQLEALVARLLTASDPAAPVALDTETTALNPFQAELVGIGVCWGEALDALAYIPIGHQPPMAADLLSAPPEAPAQLPWRRCWGRWPPGWRAPSTPRRFRTPSTTGWCCCATACPWPGW